MGENAVEDLRRRLLAVGVEEVRPGGDGFDVERLARDLEYHLAYPGARVPDSRINVTGQRRHHRISSSIGIASVRPDSGSTTA